MEGKKSENLPIDYFDFYNSVSSVYSSKIEGEEIDYDSFFKYKFLGVNYLPDYTKRSNDLFNAYQYISQQKLSWKNICEAHKVLSCHLLPETQRGTIRNNPMYVIDENEKIEYVACNHTLVQQEISLYQSDLDLLLSKELSAIDIFYFASLLHLTFVKIHPFQDGNGRIGRLIEKWFLKEKLGDLAYAVNLEKNYYTKRHDYYNNIRKLGLEYLELDYSKALDFVLMSIQSIQ